jgi:hypothetical protein
MDTLLAVIGLVGGALYAAGLAVAGSRANRTFAKVMIWISAILLGAWCIAWVIETEQPMIIRIVVGLIVGAFVFVLVPETVRRIISPSRSSERAPSTGNVINQNVTSHGQSGGITAHTVNEPKAK